MGLRERLRELFDEWTADLERDVDETPVDEWLSILRGES